MWEADLRPHDVTAVPVAALQRRASAMRRHEEPAQGGIHGTPWQDLEEDLEECIAAWQDSNRQQPADGTTQCGQGPYYSPLLYGASRSRGSSALAPELPSGTVEQMGPVISVNIGGTVFNTTATTLRKAPFFDAVLRHAEEGSLGATVDDDGRLFVDRTGELFGYVLGYLRSGHWLLRDRANDLDFVDALREEARFYGIDAVKDRLPMPRISEYVTLWQFCQDTSLYVDCLEQTIREDPDHQGLFRLCKYSGGLPLDQHTCTQRFKATSHSVQSVVAYFANRGFSLQHVTEGAMITHTTSADGQSRSGHGTQYVLSRRTTFPSLLQPPSTPPMTP